MTAALNRLFNVRNGEWRRLSAFYGMFLVYTLGRVWVLTLLEASVLVNVGVEILPGLRIVQSVLSFAVLSLYTGAVDRTPKRRMLFMLLGATAAIAGGGGLLLNLDFPRVILPLILLGTNLAYDVFMIHWWTFVNNVYDTRSAKRLVPLINSGSYIGWIVAGFTLPVLTPLIMPPQREADEAAVTDRRVSFQQSLREGVNYARRSHFLRWLALSTLALYLLAPFMEYRAREILAATIPDTVTLANYMGVLNSLVTLVYLPLQVFAFTRVVNRLGLANTHLFYPLYTSISCFLMLFTPTRLIGASLVYANDDFFPTERLLYNAIPAAIKGRAYALVSGFVQPMALLAGNTLLLGAVALRGAVPLAIGLLAAAYVGIALVIRREYSKALVAMLQQDDYSFLLSGTEDKLEIRAADAPAIAKIRERLYNSRDKNETIFLAQMVGQTQGADFEDVLIRAAMRGDSEVRAAILAILAEQGTNSAAFKAFCSACLRDGDSHVRYAALLALRDLYPPGDETLLKLTAPLTAREPDRDARALAIMLHINVKIPIYRAGALDALHRLMHSGSARDRGAGAVILGSTNDPRYIHDLLHFVEDEDEGVRLKAVQSIERLASQAQPETRAALISMGGTAFVKEEALNIRLAWLRVFGLAQYAAPLIAALADEEMQMRQTAADMLVSMGQSVLPLLMQTYERANGQAQMAAVVLARIHKERYAPLVYRLIEQRLQAVYTDLCRGYTLESYALEHRGARLLRDVFYERAPLVANEIFYMLSAVADGEALRVIRETLSSGDTYKRSNSMEALEALVTPTMARALGALLYPNPVPAYWLEIADNLWGVRPPQAEALLHEWMEHAPTPFERRLAVFVGRETDLMPDARFINASEAAAMLSTIEKIAFLKGVSFFRSMTVEQLRALAMICDEDLYSTGEQIFKQGDAGGALFVLVSGRISIEYRQNDGTSMQLAVLEPRSYFGEMALFDHSPRSATAVAIQDSLVLIVRREPMHRLIRQNPDLSMELITVLNARLRDANEQLAQARRTNVQQSA
jgi:HEAT repeat protein